jgi:hypothetical protein
MLEKNIFYVSNVLLQQRYREWVSKKYSERISCLLVAERNNELLMKNHVSWLIGSASFPEVNARDLIIIMVMVVVEIVDVDVGED